EPLHQGGVPGDVRRSDLDGHGLAGAPVAGLVDRAHAAFGDLLEQVVVADAAEPRPCGLRHRRSLRALGNKGGRRAGVPARGTLPLLGEGAAALGPRPAVPVCAVVPAQLYLAASPPAWQKSANPPELLSRLKTPLGPDKETRRQGDKETRRQGDRRNGQRR